MSPARNSARTSVSRWVMLVPAALRLAHASPPCAGETLSARRSVPSCRCARYGSSRARARAQRLFTVPGEMSRMTAASATEKPSMSTTTRAARCGGGRIRSAASTSSRVSAAGRDRRRARPGPRSACSSAGTGGPGGAAAQPVQCGVHHDPVQPGGDGRLAAEVRGPAEGGDHRVLERVGGLLRVADRAQRDRPQPVPVPAEQLAERLGVSGHMPAEQFGVRGPARRRAGMGHQPDWLAAEPCTTTL